MTARDYVDGFSTLFAFRWPGIPAGYDNRQLPLGALFAELFLDGIIPEGTEWAGEQVVFLTEGEEKTKRPMPDFERDLTPPKPRSQ